MRFKTILALGLIAVGAGACSDNSGVTDAKPIPPAALIRFINASLDTGTVDFRFIDKVENLPTFLGVGVRAASGVYQRVSPGARPVRVFVNSTDPVEAQKRLIDTTITLNADTRYTLVYEGAARGNADRLLVIEDPLTFPTPPAGQIAIRALNLNGTVGAADVRFAPTDTVKPSGVGADTVPQPRNVYAALATMITNTPFRSYSGFVNIPALPTATPKDSLYQFQVFPTGSATMAFKSTSTQRGATAPAGASYGPQPGVQIAGSVMTAVLFPATTAGSPARTSATANPGVVLIVDKPLNP
ncbi:MAG: DUF4397 domain-containing protein [Gemmatimonadaceae bacterium]|nr:DUF4397 domain-containing protein [Gemmatimonadaceae bacterium]NUQ93456.1 DUF4397 domain-containing protein [Gemmatimonadaceae bacterium]NUR20665.1 DUF4397 domain-containing protein [Gemmatimonadaceae bacterium]